MTSYMIEKEQIVRAIMSTLKNPIYGASLILTTGVFGDPSSLLLVALQEIQYGTDPKLTPLFPGTSSGLLLLPFSYAFHEYLGPFLLTILYYDHMLG
jgi:hypothetical protein